MWNLASHFQLNFDWAVLTHKLLSGFLSWRKVNFHPSLNLLFFHWQGFCQDLLPSNHIVFSTCCAKIIFLHSYHFAWTKHQLCVPKMTCGQLLICHIKSKINSGLLHNLQRLKCFFVLFCFYRSGSVSKHWNEIYGFVEQLTSRFVR